MDTFCNCKKNSNIRMYLNGKRAANVLDNLPESINMSSIERLCIGNQTDPSDENSAFEGYITNFRWTKGRALYDGDSMVDTNFTVPTSPLSQVEGTKLLFLAQKHTPFSSGRNATIGNVVWSDKTPFA